MSPFIFSAVAPSLEKLVNLTGFSSEGAYFKELLEGQFPILNPSYRMILRHPLEFADTLSVHVNHLNRSLKQVTDKTTTQLIAERMVKEAKMLLQITEWIIMEIGWSI
jgi:AraC-like DNA-binding protein